MIFVVLFSVLAVSVANTSNVNIRMSRNHRDMVKAQASAESGLMFAQYLISQYNSYAADSTFSNVVSDDDAENTFYNLAAFIQDELEDSPNLAGEPIDDLVPYTIEKITALDFHIPAISFAAGDSSTFELTIRQYDDVLHTIEIISTGAAADITRTVRLRYDIEKDNRLLDYAVASKSRIIVNGDSTIDDGIYSGWTDTFIAPPVLLAADSAVNGAINITLSQDEFEFTDEQIQGDYDQINYDQPEIDWPQDDDFDTSWYEKQTKNLSAGHTTKTKEYFPHAPGDYTLPANDYSTQLNRTVYENMTITNKHLSSGNNALFKNCTFDGIFYIKGGLGVNNVRFENCTFNGPIVTGAVPKFGPETWKKNLLYFTGCSTFKNTSMAELTILAPNFNINIGNTQTLEASQESTLSGIVLGGVVDIRGNVELDGSIISMAAPNPDKWGEEQTGIFATNVGFSDENPEAAGPADGVITITPNPDRSLPIGIKSKVVLIPDGNSYVELY